MDRVRKRLGDDVLLVTRRNVDAVALNTEARLTLRQEGKIARKEMLLPSIGRDDKSRDLAISVGERIRFGEALPEHGIRNGTSAIVEAVAEAAGLHTYVQIRLDNGGSVASRWGDLARTPLGRKRSAPRISHA